MRQVEGIQKENSVSYLNFWALIMKQLRLKMAFAYIKCEYSTKIKNKQTDTKLQTLQSFTLKNTGDLSNAHFRRATVLKQIISN